MKGIAHQVGEFLKTDLDSGSPQVFRVYVCHDYLQLDD